MKNRFLSQGVDVKSTWRNKPGDMSLVLKKEAVKSNPIYKGPARKVLGENEHMRALILQCNNIDEITDAEEFATALKQQCAVDVPSASIRLREDPVGSQLPRLRFQ